VDGLLTGLHEPRSSHLRMLAAFHGSGLLAACYEAAVAHGYLWHEFGDVHLLLPLAGNHWLPTRQPGLPQARAWPCQPFRRSDAATMAALSQARSVTSTRPNR